MREDALVGEIPDSSNSHAARPAVEKQQVCRCCLVRSDQLAPVPEVDDFALGYKKNYSFCEKPEQCGAASSCSLGSSKS